MLQGSRITTLAKFNNALTSAKSGRDFFVDELCNLISQEYEIKAVVIFKAENSFLKLLGKSHGVKKNFTNGDTFPGENCYDNKITEEFNFYRDENCLLQISDTPSHEISISFRLDVNEIVVLRVAQNNPFLPTDLESLKTVALFVKNLIHIWLQARGGITTSETSIFGIISKLLNEIRTITNSIVGSTAILNDENLLLGDTSYFKTIKNNSHKLLSTINSFGELVKVYNGNIEIKESDVELKKTIKETVDLLNTKLQSKNVSFHLNYDESIPKEISVDKQKFQLFLNSLLTGKS